MQQKAQNEAIHLQVRDCACENSRPTSTAKLSLLDARLKAATEAAMTRRSYPPGVRKTENGHHYVPDPKRPGKYLLVVDHV